MNLFISYRRADSEWQADRLYRALGNRIPQGQVFLDVETINVGWDFRQDIADWIEQCDAVLILIGNQWTNVRSDGASQSRLFETDDPVRFEIETALSSQVPVVPVIIDQTPMPVPTELPESLHGLLHRAGTRLGVRTFDADVEALLTSLRRSIDISSAPIPVPDPAVQPNLTDEEALALSFLKAWPTWGFTVSRVQNFGGQHAAYERLSQISKADLTEILVGLAERDLIRQRTSKRGNTLYQAGT